MRKFTKRSAAVAGAAVLATGAGVAFAASMTVNSSTLGAGTHNVSSACDLTVSYAGPTDTSYSGGKYQLTGVTVTPLGTCAGKAFKVTVATNDSTPVTGEATGTFDSNTGALDVAFSSNATLDASKVSNVSAVVTGGTSS